MEGVEPAGRTKLKELELQLQALYERLVTGDRIAAPELVELIWMSYASRGGLITLLRDRGSLSHDEAKDELLSLVAEFATKFVASIIAGTSTYDPEKAPLGPYVQMALHGDVLNEAEKARRYRARHDPLGENDVGEAVYPWNLQQTEEDQVLDRMELTNKLKGFRDSLSREDEACFDLMVKEVRETEPYAEALGITHLPIEAQQKTVNNIKDRLKKRLKRLP